MEKAVKLFMENLYEVNITKGKYFSYDRSKKIARTVDTSTTDKSMNILKELPYVPFLEDKVLVLIQSQKLAISFPQSVILKFSAPMEGHVEFFDFKDLYPCRTLAIARSGEISPLGIVPTESKKSDNTAVIVIIIIILLLFLLCIWYYFFYRRTIYRNVEKTVDVIKEKDKTTTVTATTTVTEREAPKMQLKDIKL